METTENQRLKILRLELGISQKDFAIELGIQPGSLADIERGKVGISKKVKVALENRAGKPINLNWLETGKGERFLPHPDMSLEGIRKRSRGGEYKASSGFYEPEIKYRITPVKAQMVPIYNVEFAPGVLGRLIANDDKSFPVGYLGTPEVSGCDAIIRVKGDNMAGKINDGDWIGVKRIDKDQWFPMGHIYAIETDQVQIVQYIKKGPEPKKFKIASHNKLYDDDEIHADIIKELWSVKTILPFSKIETII